MRTTMTFTPSLPFPHVLTFSVDGFVTFVRKTFL
jgi:hypothetical protein